MILHFLINKTDLRSNLTIAASFYCSTVHNIFLWRRVVECISLCFLSTRKSVELINIYFVHCSAEYDMIKYAYHVHPGTSSRYYLCTEEPSRSSPSRKSVLLIRKCKIIHEMALRFPYTKNNMTLAMFINITLYLM
jgi:hypothetical protein